MFKSLFSINLNLKHGGTRVVAGKVSYGKFDGQHYCMVAAISDDKVLVHHPYYSNQQPDNVEARSLSSDVNILNINQKINSLCCGKFRTEDENDLLVVGTQTSLLVYDVYNNKDLFFKEIPDGSNCVAISQIGSLEKTIAISGSNSAIQGFDQDGNDSYWTVTGDNVTCMCPCDINQDGLTELITGSDGNEICVFKDDTILFDIQETDFIKCLCHLEANYFAYGLRNGTVGVYCGKERVWRIKSKKEVICVASLDVNDDGQMELITGKPLIRQAMSTEWCQVNAWSSGKMDVRDIKTGQVIHKETFKDAIAGLFVCDYNQDRKDELIVVTVTGEITGLQVVESKNKLLSSKEDQLQARKFEQEKIRELLLLRHSLQLELRNYENNNRISDEQAYAEEQDLNFKMRTLTEHDGFGAIPANTQLKSSLTLCTGASNEHRDPCIELALETTNDTIIRAVIIFAEGIFNQESFIAHPNENEVANNLTVQLRPERNVTLDLHVKAIVGYNRSNHYHVFELTRNLPKFSMFALIRGEQFEQPTGKAVYSFSEKANKLIMWLGKNFLVDDSDCYVLENEQFTANLKCLRTSMYCLLDLNEAKSQLVIRCNSMQMTGEIIQSIVSDLYPAQSSSLNLSCTASFPADIERLRKLVNQIGRLESVRQQLNADFADNSAMIKELIIKAEDARLLDEFKLMKQYYGELNSMNKDLINGFRVRNQNQQELIGSLKEINLLIQQAANLRVGKFKSEIVQASRQAIKQNNLNLISRIISGED